MDARRKPCAAGKGAAAPRPSPKPKPQHPARTLVVRLAHGGVRLLHLGVQREAVGCRRGGGGEKARRAGLGEEKASAGWATWEAAQACSHCCCQAFGLPSLQRLATQLSSSAHGANIHWKTALAMLTLQRALHHAHAAQRLDGALQRLVGLQAHNHLQSNSGGGAGRGACAVWWHQQAWHLMEPQRMTALRHGMRRLAHPAAIGWHVQQQAAPSNDAA